MNPSFRKELEKIVTPAVASEIAARTSELAARLSAVLIDAPADDARSLLNHFMRAICEELRESRTPVPVAVIELALQEFDDKAIVEELRRVRESGGLKLEDFYGDLERLVRSGE